MPDELAVEMQTKVTIAEQNIEYKEKTNPRQNVDR